MTISTGPVPARTDAPGSTAGPATPLPARGELAQRGSVSRSFVLRHPVTTFLVVAHAVMWTSWLPVLFLGAPPRPFSAVGSIVGLTLPAFVLTWATDGRDGVRDFLRRCLRWRVGIPWYLIALFGIPFGTLLAATLLPGATALGSVGNGWAPLLSGFLVDLFVAVVTVQLFEEAGWTGFAQHRLQARHGALRASLLLAPAFATIHLPTYFTAPITGQVAVRALSMFVLALVFAIFFRTLIAWMYNRTASSILLAVVLHASFNTASGSGFLARLGAAPALSMLPLVAVAVFALAVTVWSRGRLAYQSGREPIQQANV